MIPLLEAQGHTTFGDVISETRRHGRLLQKKGGPERKPTNPRVALDFPPPKAILDGRQAPRRGWRDSGTGCPYTDARGGSLRRFRNPATFGGFNTSQTMIPMLQQPHGRARTGLHGRLRAKAGSLSRRRDRLNSRRFARVSLPFQPRQAVHGRVKKKEGQPTCRTARNTNFPLSVPFPLEEEA